MKPETKILISYLEDSLYYLENRSKHPQKSKEIKRIKEKIAELKNIIDNS